jgi:hypothetical protein
MEAVSRLDPDAKFFMKLDLTKGYWQMLLDKKSQDLTTFITSLGKFKYLCSFMGFVSIGNSYSYQGDVALSGLPIEKVVDDIAGGAKTFRALVSLVCDTLEGCIQFRFAVNGSKSILCARENEIDFVGYKVSHNSIQADLKKVSAIQELPTPISRTDLKSFMGLVNQLGQFSPKIAQEAGP